MTVQDKLSQAIIYLFLNPFRRHNPVDFQDVLNKADTVLISCPVIKESPITSEIIHRYMTLFSAKTCTLICPDTTGNALHGPIDSALLLDFSKQTLWHVLRSEVLKKLSETNWDVLLDLDTEFNILNAYLSRKLQPILSIGFQKPYSQKFLNLEYNSQSTDPYNKKLDGLFRFLQQFF